jgi:hypothetical protein
MRFVNYLCLAAACLFFNEVVWSQLSYIDKRHSLNVALGIQRFGPEQQIYDHMLESNFDVDIYFLGLTSEQPEIFNDPRMVFSLSYFYQTSESHAIGGRLRYAMMRDVSGANSEHATVHLIPGNIAIEALYRYSVIERIRLEGGIAFLLNRVNANETGRKAESLPALGISAGIDVMLWNTSTTNSSVYVSYHYSTPGIIGPYIMYRGSDLPSLSVNFSYLEIAYSFGFNFGK